MSLRDQLKKAVASCAPIETQLATLRASNATGSATAAQQPPVNPRGIRKPGATDSATPAQLRAKNDATFTPPEVASCATVAPVASALTAEREMRKLLAVAMRAAAHWRDDPGEWRQQCLEVPPHQRADLLDYLQRQYPKP